MLIATSLAWPEVVPTSTTATQTTTQTKKKRTKKKSTSHTASTGVVKTTSAKSKKSSSKGKQPPKKRGQQSIDSERASEIQTALVKAGYLKEEHSSGRMDDRTKEALTRLQAENGWQTKVVPDSRALIKLGLGPDHSAVINKDTAVLSSVPKSKAEVPDK